MEETIEGTMDQKTISINLPSRTTIYPEQDLAIDRVLSELLTRCPAQFIMLIEVSGQLISFAGDRSDMDLIALASLVAGDMAASQAIARQTGQYQSCQLILREGLKANTFLCEVGTQLVLLTQVARDVPLGWARLLISETSGRLADIITTAPENIEKLSLDLNPDSLDSLLDSALNSLWKEE